MYTPFSRINDAIEGDFGEIAHSTCIQTARFPSSKTHDVIGDDLVEYLLTIKVDYSKNLETELEAEAGERNPLYARPLVSLPWLMMMKGGNSAAKAGC